ncbi:hypothetical protein PHLGIDRAFT_25494 [Phlebiopsis gigantea 11061_1 CR5-6]|uniref:Transmembrane protein n=1 Tax=Phlebiopsis gigantea (strain 11061_1 CR5-6) TaxID=745531 RepID=A0A0C3NID3_PHLG1|nr:hypothetical protein PHLGIDRAFT_25494 [Phlebiopsis gigantea 11061_1 CR5-6]
MVKFSKMRVKGGPVFHHVKRDSCSSGGFYKNPTAGQSVSATSPLNITWDPSCMTTTAVDIYLYDPNAATPRIHMWETVDFAPGFYEATLNAKWWNSSSTASLQLAIVEGGTAPFLATLPAGPVFTATYDSSATNVTENTATSSIQVVNNVPKTTQSLSKGKVAAAVIMPLLIVAAIIAGVYIKISRQKGREKRKRWSEVVDKRMSTISTDWKSVTPAGASAAIRASMAFGEGGERASSFSFGAIRPTSSIAVESGHAGIGAKGLAANGGGIDLTTPQMSELRSGPRPQVATGERVSRVSFAADTRPSGESRRSQYNSRTSRAFHTGHVPPLPMRQDSGELSPTQTHGPMSLSAEDINARMSGPETTSGSSVDEVMPALSMMRTGAGGLSTDDLLFPPEPALPSPPEPSFQIPKTSIVGVMPMQPMPASVMSPDEMLRAYAERRAVASPPPIGAPALPAPVVNYNGNGMRTLYSPTSPTTDIRKSFAPTENSRYSLEDAYGGTAH